MSPALEAAPNTVASEVPYRLTRIGAIMSPDPDRPEEAEGVLNPATTWGSDGRLYIYPRLVASGNVSRVGYGRVVVEDGVPVGVERLGIALDPSRGWEHGQAHGGVEDPRITRIDSLGLDVMAYVAFGPLGPRPAIAVSDDRGITWKRLGPLQFGYEDELDTDLNLFPNKDVVFFPDVVPGPDGRPSYAMLHRPMWDFGFTRPNEPIPYPEGLSERRASIWISYVDANAARADVTALTRPAHHTFVAGPQYAWEDAKIGAGPAPIRVPEGWLLVHHGVTGQLSGDAFTPQQNVRYVAGMMLLDADAPGRVLARTSKPVLEPEVADEQVGTVGNVVFPTSIETIEGNDYVFYGMADSRIGVARLDRVDR